MFGLNTCYATKLSFQIVFTSLSQSVCVGLNGCCLFKTVTLFTQVFVNTAGFFL